MHHNIKHSLFTAFSQELNNILTMGIYFTYYNKVYYYISVLLKCKPKSKCKQILLKKCAIDKTYNNKDNLMMIVENSLLYVKDVIVHLIF